MKIGITGIDGRMGRQIADEVILNDLTDISYGFVHKDSEFKNRNIKDLIPHSDVDLTLSNDIDRLFKLSDIVIDFSSPELSLLCAKKSEEYKKILISGTTGFTIAQMNKFSESGGNAVIVWSSNMSIGINLLMNLSENVARILHDDYDAEIFEMHHKNKIDAPSGTALSLGKAVAKGRGLNFGEVSKRTRDGITGERKKNEIGFASLRGGDVIGDHNVIFAGDGERIELSHKASNRKIYAKGAIRAAIWATNQKEGFYSMQDVLEL